MELILDLAHWFCVFSLKYKRFKFAYNIEIWRWSPFHWTELDAFCFQAKPIKKQTMENQSRIAQMYRGKQPSITL